MKKELPDGWEWKKLGNVATVGAGNGAPQGDNYYENGEHPFVRTSDVGQYGQTICLKSPRDKLNDIALEKFKLKFWPKNTLLIPKSGASTFLNHRALLGEAAYVSSHLATVIPNNCLLPEYLYYWSLSLDAKHLTPNTNYPSLKLSDIESANIPVPPLETQHHIVSILEKAEENKKMRAQADELTQQLLQSVFLEMFGDPVTNNKNWDTKKLKDLCLDIYGGGTPSKSKSEYYDGEIPWVTPKDMKQDFISDSIDHITENAISNSSAKVIPSDSLLMVIRSGILKKKLPVAINTCDVTLNQDMKGFVFDKKIVSPLFMLYYFKSYQKYLLNRVRSVTADNLEFQQIKMIEVILPDIELQTKFAAIVNKLKQTNEQQKKSSTEIDTLFNALMQKAFNGELIAE
ncbi:restriction endonuclease subunit S [Methanolobus bombayensis]|uniref:restriction endonuclease subunit S n=1 Tax=Methanolobus bombayensis TaxID=38023 RepID=UPI001AE2BA40|nr:restriction endonuclease subunit S [Methanolobus bombayensis]MBP1908378.1 type I restriction enzyme S subunit [Methanolobus bombayensis]